MIEKLLKVAGGLVVLLLAYWVLVFFADAKQTGPAGVRNEMTNLVAGLAYYHASFGSFPTGDNAQVMDALRGKNPQKLLIDPIGPRRLNNGRELLDIWDAPYRFTFTSNATINITSAGNNGRFDDEDDLVVQAALSDTNFPFMQTSPQPVQVPTAD